MTFWNITVRATPNNNNNIRNVLKAHSKISMRLTAVCWWNLWCHWLYTHRRRFGLKWPVIWINIFGFLTLHLKTYVEQENSILAKVKQVGVREHESCDIRCSPLSFCKGSNATASVSNYFPTGSRTSLIRLVIVIAVLTQFLPIRPCFVNDRQRVKAECACLLSVGYTSPCTRQIAIWSVLGNRHRSTCVCDRACA